MNVGAGWRARLRQRLFRTAPADAGPIRLRHRRIYILPTARGLAFIGTVSIMLVTSLNYALSLAFAVTFLLAGLIAAALLLAYRNLAGLELRPIAAGEAFVGGQVVFSLALAGYGQPRFAIGLAARGAAPVLADVPGSSPVPVALLSAAAHRGRQTLGRLTLASSYPLGLWRAWAYVHFPLAGIVYPAPEPDAPPLPAGTTGTGADRPTRSDDADLAGLRAYQAGDPLQRIAWKAVARGSGWHTKQFEGAGGGGNTVLAWDATPGTLGDEARLARLAAWVLAAERLARPFALALPGAYLPEGKGREQCHQALVALALWRPEVS